jgi:predicted PurR-regulated permease PerM
VVTTATASERDPAHEAARVLRGGGRLAWGFVGIVLAASIVLSALAVASSVVLPLFLAVVLATLFRPLVRWLERFRLPASLASGVVVVSIVLAAIGFVWMVVVAIVREGEELLRQLEAALGELGIDEAAAQSISEAIESLVPTVLAGVAEAIVSGIDTLSGLIAGTVLGILILYYMLKEGAAFLRSAEERMLPGRADQLGYFATDAATVMRRYWLGRTIVSAVVAGVVAVAAAAMGLPMVLTLAAVTFVGGYIPYIGAFIGGLLAVVVAIAEEGLGAGLLMLLVVLVANLVVENMVDPHVTGRTLRIHPLVVLLVTTIGGVLGGLVGLMMAVPMTVIGVRAVRYFRAAFEVDAHLRPSLFTDHIVDRGDNVGT